jgi:16S rRNA (cytidine1402-2'-O)-methyltransferase
MSKPVVYLIPSLLAENAQHTLPAEVLEAVKHCKVFFVENERSARRFLKSIWKEIVIDDYPWVTIHKAEKEVRQEFEEYLRKGWNIGIISEAGCPGVADPGQILVKTAHALGARVKPLTGPSSILLALMGAGLNGQKFQFNGYLPIDHHERVQKIRDYEAESSRKNCTQIFIETPYRNMKLLETLARACKPDTLISIAVNLTAPDEMIITRPAKEWKKGIPDIHKKPAIFSMLAC